MSEYVASNREDFNTRDASENDSSAIRTKSGISELSRRKTGDKRLAARTLINNDLWFDPHCGNSHERDIGLAYGLQLLTKRDDIRARNCLLANLWNCARTGKDAVFVVRDRNEYTKRVKLGYPTHWTRKRHVEQFNSLESAGLIACRPPTAEGLRSTIVPTVKLRTLFSADVIGAITIADVRHNNGPVLCLKDHEKRPLPMPDNRGTRLMDRQMRELNEFMRRPKIELRSPRWRRISETVFARDYVVADGDTQTATVDLTRTDCRRVFNNCDLRQGGRLYDSFVQSLSKEDRLCLSIDGEPVAEHDHAALHARLASAVIGMPWIGSQDFYALDAVNEKVGDATLGRKLVKVGFMILMNAGTARKATGGVAEMLSAMKVTTIRAKELIAEIKRAMPQFEPIWHTGIGVRLQRIDGDMAVATMLALKAEGIAVLPVHDSFVVQERHIGKLRVAMDSAMTIGLAFASRMGRDMTVLKTSNS